MRVCIDAGHGGRDPGAIGRDPFELMEKEFNLACAEYMDGHLRALGHEVIMTRRRDRYLALENNIAEEKVFKREKPVRWVCRNCGYVYEGTDAPDICPACAHPQSYYEIEAANY